MKQAQKPSNRNRTNLLVDCAIFLGFLIVLAPHFTGQTIHEWLGISLAAGVITHLLLHWQWIIEVTKRFLRAAQWSARINYILNALLFIDIVVIIFAGLMISESALPLIHISLGHGGIWKTIHVQAANLFLYLMGLHVALHWQWIVNVVKRMVPMSRRAAKPTAAPLDLPSEV